VQRRLALSREKMLRVTWRDRTPYDEEARTQAIGRTAWEAGLEGLLLPSVHKGAKNWQFSRPAICEKQGAAVKHSRRFALSPAISGHAEGADSEQCQGGGLGNVLDITLDRDLDVKETGKVLHSPGLSDF
jgi:RES domain-containing protein